MPGTLLLVASNVADGNNSAIRDQLREHYTRNICDAVLISSVHFFIMSCPEMFYFDCI